LLAQLMSMAIVAHWAIFTNMLLLWMFFVACAVTIIGLTLFLSAVIKTQMVAVLVGYGIALILANVSTTLEQSLLRKTTDMEWLMLVPTIAMASSLSAITRSCDYGCLSFIDLTSYNRFTGGLLFMLIDGFIFGLLGMYLDAVLPSQHGVRMHPLFPIKHMIRSIKSWRKTKTTESKRLLDPAPSDTFELNDDERVDQDVANENYRAATLVDNGSATNDEPLPIIIDRMSKNYGVKKALKSLSLVVDKGQCLGLLGPNGAGKTTMISILVGLHAPSDGTSIVNGYDIRSDMDLVQQSLGLCPQHEILWADLTVEEHLLFYARLKNVARSEEKSSVASAMEGVGLLDEKAKSLSSTLSGGQKKRLAIAMSMVGNPSIILLDEPTTGLDPTSRRQIWDIITKAKANRSIILTTHSLDEADILSDRIAIMSNGSLKCIGTSMHLKNKFGSGYRLSVNYSPPNRQIVDDYIINKLSCGLAVVNSVFSGNSVYDMPKDINGKSVADIFTELEVNKDSARIVDWSFSQSTLEDVFINIVNKDEGVQVVSQ